MKPEPDLIESYGTIDTYCERLVRIDQIGPNRRLVFGVQEPREPNTAIIVAKLIMSAEALAEIARKCAADNAQRHPAFEAMPRDLQPN